MVDECGFYPLPSILKTYAPRAHTPVLRVKQSRDHLSMMGGVTITGQLFTLTREEALNSGHSILFLRHLLREIGHKLLIVWDGSPIHRGEAVRKFLAEGGSPMIHLEQFPGYAPDLNPQEGVWRHLKAHELGNVACADLYHLSLELRRAVRRSRNKPGIIRACFLEAGLSA